MELPKGGIVGRTVAHIRKIQKMGIPGHAANAGYFIVVSIFPALVLVLSLLRYTGTGWRWPDDDHHADEKHLFRKG